MLILTVVDAKFPELFATVADLATGHLFDFNLNVFAPSPKAEDSYLKLNPITAETHKNVKVLYTENGPDPANAARYAVFFHATRGGPLVLQPYPVGTTNAPAPTMHLVFASVSR